MVREMELLLCISNFLHMYSYSRCTCGYNVHPVQSSMWATPVAALQLGADEGRLEEEGGSFLSGRSLRKVRETETHPGVGLCLREVARQAQQVTGPGMEKAAERHHLFTLTVM